MHILIIADGRSPTSRRWIQTVQSLEHTTSLISTYPCEPLPGVEDLRVLPVAFSSAAGQPGTSGQAGSSWLRAIRRFRPAAQMGRAVIGPLTLRRYARPLNRIISELQPDLVHALRIPYEGMLASMILPPTPLAVSIWGNDLTLHAPSSRLLASWTRRTLARADGLAADAQRDIRLARAWGFPANRPVLVVPGGGGVNLEELARSAQDAADPLSDLAPEAPLVVNPRGIRAYARSDTFFQSIPLVLERRPEVTFACPAMAGQPEAEGWVQRLQLDKRVRLLPNLTQPQLWQLFQRAQVLASITTHDGSPNTVLEGMACGCFPVAGDIEALREWITPGVNGLLVEPDKPGKAAEAILLALDQPALRSRAAELNQQAVLQRAEVSAVRSQLSVFYQWVWGLR